jgi:hypothetical protein
MFLTRKIVFLINRDDPGKSARRERGRNIYVSPATLRPMEKKGSKADVTSLRYLWVDIDPDGDVDPMDAAALDPVREAVLGLLTALPVGVPPPTWIIDSGRGIWAIWELARPFAKPDDAADGNTAWLEPHESVGAGIIEAINEALAIADIRASADHCYNADRVARLPNTECQDWPHGGGHRIQPKPALHVGRLSSHRHFKEAGSYEGE